MTTETKKEPSLGGRSKWSCTCAEAQGVYLAICQPRLHEPAWRMPAFTEISQAEERYKEAAKNCEVCSRKEKCSD